MSERKLSKLAQLTAAAVFAVSATGLGISINQMREKQNNAGDAYSRGLDLGDLGSELSFDVSQLEGLLEEADDSRSSIIHTLAELPPELDAQEEIAAIKTQLAGINTDSSMTGIDSIKGLLDEIHNHPDYQIAGDVEEKQVPWLIVGMVSLYGTAVGLIGSGIIGVMNIERLVKRRQKPNADSIISS